MLTSKYAHCLTVAVAMFATVFAASSISATIRLDPCGMVPPIYTGQSPIARKGLQQTYVFHRNGIESFMIRPGYEGKIDNFGMLIPFPSPPSIRKVHDDIFQQVKNAIDPPEVVVDLLPVPVMNMAPANAGGDGMVWRDELKKNEVAVLRQEAVGMYEVVVLAAGSAEALKKWMDENGYQFPEGMEAVASDYIEQRWCFVAVKTKVTDKEAVDPAPGQRQTNPGLPEGSVFEGQVQGLAFRFPTDELVVPMRLSAFNEGDTRNVVYLLTDGAKRIRNIPEEYVRRQISGRQLVDNLTRPVPLRIIGGKIEDLSPEHIESLKTQRDPDQYNGIAARLFWSDIEASQMPRDGDLILESESTEKNMVLINERLGLRGTEVDNLLVDAMKDRIEKDEATLEIMRGMTMTVVDGDFPRDVLASENLKFDNFQMAAALNTIEQYDTKTHEGAGNRGGVLYLGAITPRESNPRGNTPHDLISETQTATESSTPVRAALPVIATVLFASLFISIRRKSIR